MKRRLDMEKIAKELGAVRRGKVSASAGYFGALQLLADVSGQALAELLHDSPLRGIEIERTRTSGRVRGVEL